MRKAGNLTYMHARRQRRKCPPRRRLLTTQPASESADPRRPSWWFPVKDQFLPRPQQQHFCFGRSVSSEQHETTHESVAPRPYRSSAVHDFEISRKNALALLDLRACVRSLDRCRVHVFSKDTPPDWLRPISSTRAHVPRAPASPYPSANRAPNVSIQSNLLSHRDKKAMKRKTQHSSHETGAPPKARPNLNLSI